MKSTSGKLQVQTKPNSSDVFPVSGILQRKCACGKHTTAGGECESCQKEKTSGQLQRAAVRAEPVNEATPIVHDVLRSSGQPLDVATRAFMELRFAHDFSRVRVHTDAKAAESARAVNSLAYTVGRDVVFGRGEYVPGTTAGRKLIAHELTHVVQQGGSRPVAGSHDQIAAGSIHPSLVSSAKSLNISHPQDAAEVEADRNSNLIATGSSIAVNMPAFYGVLNRQSAPPQPSPASAFEDCKKANQWAQICQDDERHDREEAVVYFLMNKKNSIDHGDIGAMDWKKIKTFGVAEIRDCDNASGESWHCDVTIKNKGVRAVSIFKCLCCNKDDGKTSHNWNGAHWSGKDE